MSTLNSLDDIKRILRSVENKINITLTGPPDGNISEADVTEFITEVENYVLGRISIYYDTTTIVAPATGFLKLICGRLTCFAIYTSIYQSQIPEKAPDAIMAWEEDAREDLRDLLLQASEGKFMAGFIVAIVSESPVRYNKPDKIFIEKGIEGISTNVRDKIYGILRDVDVEGNV